MRISKKEVPKTALQAAKLKIKKLEEKFIRTGAKNKERTKENQRLKKNNQVLKTSRDLWKGKATARKKVIKSLQGKRLSLNIDLSEGSPARHHYDLLIITIAVLLRVKCQCSYRSIPKILEIIFNILGNRKIELSDLPCSNSIENWVSKSGYSELKSGVKKYEGKEVCLILDESIRVGREKLLVGLICDAEKTEAKGLSFEDVDVSILEGRVSWKGKDIAAVVNTLSENNNLTVSYIVSDEGNNLKCAIKEIGCPHVPDISHAIANCLKREFASSPAYKAFTADAKKYQAKLIMGENSFFRPKKQRAKARFMNQEDLIIWGEIILDKWTTFSKEVQNIFKEMPSHRTIIERLRKGFDLVTQVSKVLTTKGINNKSIEEAMNEVNKVDENNSIKIVISELKKYLNKYKEVLENKLTEYQNIFGCSKVIERLFGVYKEKVSTNYFNGVTVSCLELPLVCLPTETLKQNLKASIETVFMSNIDEWKTKNESDNQSVKRKNLLKR
jgi:hypothetical protein